MIEDIVREIQQILSANKCQVERISVDMLFADLGLTSITFIQLLIDIEKKYDFEFQDSDLILDNYHWVRDFVNVIYKNLKGERNEN